MVVVVIIAILIGILVPTIGKVRQTALEAEVRKDIGDLEQAIEQFKVSFGIEPPSYIELYANQADWDANPKYKSLIKQMWSKFDFSNCGGASVGSSGPKNFVLPNSSTATVLKLNGSECLVFFLGGMIDPTSGGFTGFAKDPARPFSSVATVTNREGPFFEFKGALKTTPSPEWAGRLTDNDLDWIPEYRDPLPGQTLPYVYFNGVNGSYRTTSGAPPPPLPLPLYDPMPPSWYTGAAWYNTDGEKLLYFAYYSKLDNTNPRSSLPHKPKGIQIISPGADRSYGWGGLFDPNNTGSLGKDDKDNITNFHSRRLGG
jgi:type II secretory pathway pseudopilin PulG